MVKNKKLLCFLVIFTLFVSLLVILNAHSGRTDRDGVESGQGQASLIGELYDIEYNDAEDEEDKDDNKDNEQLYAYNSELKLQVHFIDVGQADSIFIDYGDIDILIDGGNNEDGELVVNYLKALGTDDIELMVATHPHEDHIGGLDTVIYNFDVKKIIKPAFAENTKTNRDFEEAISYKNIPVENPEQGETIEFGELKFIVLSDKTKKYSETNNYSIVLKMIYGDISFIFTGDAEVKAEHDIIASGIDLKADVLKVGHHGGGTSTTAQFAKAVSPEYAVISVGKNNSYGHPDNIIINRLSLLGARIYRTDTDGTIVFETDGKNITVQTEKQGEKQELPSNTNSATTNRTAASQPAVIPAPGIDETTAKLTISYSASLIYNNSVGNEWSTWIEIDGKKLYQGQNLEIEVSGNDEIVIIAYACEDDSMPDIGYKQITIPVSELNPVQNVYTAEVIVRENGGRYSGNTAKWKFSISIVKK